VVRDILAAHLARAAARVQNTVQTPATLGDTVAVQSVRAALELDLLNHLDPNTAPAGAADYQLARAAAAASEPAVSLHHLEQAVRQSAVYAAVALEDPAFHDIRGAVQELADHVNLGASGDQSPGTYQPRAMVPPGLATSTAATAGDKPVVTNPPQILETGWDAAPKASSTPLAQAPAMTTGPTKTPSLALPDAPDDVSAPPLPAPPLPGRSPAPPAQPAPPAAGPALPRALAAALDLALLQSWDSEPARAAAAGEYQLARNAIQNGDRPAALQHLEQAILAHPAQAGIVLADPAFDSIKGPVRDLVTRLTLAARLRAETSISDARAALQSSTTWAASRPLLLARAYLQAAIASFQLGTYTGFVQAAFAAECARQIAEGKRSRRWLRWSANALAPVKRAAGRTARRLWQRLPLLAILLGWFFAGIVAALASLPFEAGAAFRAWLLPVWAMGLMAFVLFGFVRSIRRIGKPRR